MLAMIKFGEFVFKQKLGARKIQHFIKTAVAVA